MVRNKIFRIDNREKYQRFNNKVNWFNFDTQRYYVYDIYFIIRREQYVWWSDAGVKQHYTFQFFIRAWPMIFMHLHLPFSKWKILKIISKFHIDTINDIRRQYDISIKMNSLESGICELKYKKRPLPVNVVND